jgi:hypothetical protein
MREYTPCPPRKQEGDALIRTSIQEICVKADEAGLAFRKAKKDFKNSDLSTRIALARRVLSARESGIFSEHAAHVILSLLGVDGGDMNPTVESSVIQFPRIYQSRDKDNIQVSEIETAVKAIAEKERSKKITNGTPPTVNGHFRDTTTSLNSPEKDEYIAAIQRWAGEVRLQKAMECVEIAEISGLNRHIVLSKGLLPNIVHLCRRTKADARPGLLAIIHLCADNDDGLCRLSVARMAQLLNRKDNNIRDALDSLEEGGEIGVCRSPSGNSYWPRMPAELASMNPSVGWFVDALSEKPQPAHRPRKGRKSSVNLTPSAGEGSSKEFHPDENNLTPFRSVTLPLLRGTYITKINPSKKKQETGLTITIDVSGKGTHARGSSRPGCDFDEVQP